MSQYATAAEFRVTYPDAASSDDTALGAILTRASAVVDLVTGKTWATAGAAAPRTYYGSGTPYLRLDPFTDTTILAASVSMPSGYTVPAFATSSPYLVATSETGLVGPVTWPEGVPVVVTAAYGYSAAPDDIKEATLEIAANVWRETYQTTDAGQPATAVGSYLSARAEQILRLRRGAIFALVGAP